MNLRIEQGSTFERVFKWCNPVPGSSPPVADEDNPIDITDYSAKLEVRTHKGEPNTVAPLLQLFDGAGLTIDGPEGTITLTLTDEETEALTFTNGVWDLKVESPGGVKTRLIEGHISVSSEVTQ